jgi:Na+/H+ antiporter NhaC
MAERFLDALRESIITQAVITVAVVGVWLFLIATGQPIPPELSGILTLVIGFYFGSKVGYRQGEIAISRHAPRRVNDMSIADFDALLKQIDETRKESE